MATTCCHQLTRVASRRELQSRLAPKFGVGEQDFAQHQKIAIMRPNKSLKHKNAGPYTIVRVIGNHAYELKINKREVDSEPE
jgi:hypothetical protein